MKNKILITIVAISSLIALQSCGGLSSGGSENSFPSLAESETCSTNTSYSSSTTITGTARFYKRILNVSTASGQVSQLKLSDSFSSARPIKYAEIRVTNSAGTIVQCGKTNGTGLLKALDGTSDLKIPNTADTYKISVLSRASVSSPVLANFTVKNDIYENAPYAISKSIASTGAASYAIGNIDATANENVDDTIPGGAFNIYNDIITSYNYISTTLGTSPTCLGNKLHVYWKAGFNPGTYMGYSADNTISFYIRGDSEMYINGGVSGDVATSDTDHFDDAVIIHELGHHIEDACGSMDSPGGSHNGLRRIDPRLAWSEGWGNFFGAHIIRNNLSSINPDITLPDNEWLFYYDSGGYGTNGFEYIRINLARKGNNVAGDTNSFDPADPTNYPGESHFREVSISRGLFKMTNTCSGVFAGNCANTNSFDKIWGAFDKITGIGQSIYPFKSSSRLLYLYKQNNVLTSAQSDILNNDEALQTYGDSDFITSGYLKWPAYGTKLAVQSSQCANPLRMEPRRNVVYTSSGTTYYTNFSDQRYSNHFYWIDKASLNGASTITLEKTYVSGTSNLDMGLKLFNPGYAYNEECSSSSCTKATSTSISASSLTAGTNYLLNVRAFMGTPNNAIATNTVYNYNLKVNGGYYLCPSSY